VTRYVCRTLGIALDELSQAVDGDTLVLAWPGANGFSKASVESRALGLGLDVVVMVQPAVWQEVTTDNNR
jgi:hypothetical protein